MMRCPDEPTVTGCASAKYDETATEPLHVDEAVFIATVYVRDQRYGVPVPNRAIRHVIA
jgi:hypothetical protein